MRRKHYLLLIFVLTLTTVFSWNWAADQETTVAAKEDQKPDRPKEIVGKDGAEMVLIPAGEFEMGMDLSELPQLAQWAEKWDSSKKDTWWAKEWDFRKQPNWWPPPHLMWFEDEAPRHTVHLDAFYIDKYEVTNELYRKFMDETGHRSECGWHNSQFEAPNHPVVGVFWDEAKAYAEWAGKRLPTEAEWEKAARGGLVGRRFPWGDSDPDGTQSNFADKSADRDWSDKTVDDGYQRTAPVGSFTPNGYGLYDMAGNVREWCADWYDSGYYANSPNRNPTGPGSGTERVARGGVWFYGPGGLRVANRVMLRPKFASVNLGFRCVSRD